MACPLHEIESIAVEQIEALEALSVELERERSAVIRLDLKALSEIHKVISHQLKCLAGLEKARRALLRGGSVADVLQAAEDPALVGRIVQHLARVQDLAGRVFENNRKQREYVSHALASVHISLSILDGGMQDRPQSGCYDQKGSVSQERRLMSKNNALDRSV